MLPSSHKKVNAEERGGRKGGRGSRPLPCLLPPQAGAARPGHAGTLVRAFFRPLSLERARVRARASSPPFFSGRPSLHGHGRTASRPRHSRARSQPAPAAPRLHAQRPGPGLPGPNPVQGRGQWGGALYWRLQGPVRRPAPGLQGPGRRGGAAVGSVYPHEVRQRSRHEPGCLVVISCGSRARCPRCAAPNFVRPSFGERGTSHPRRRRPRHACGGRSLPGESDAVGHAGPPCMRPSPRPQAPCARPPAWWSWICTIWFFEARPACSPPLSQQSQQTILARGPHAHAPSFLAVKKSSLSACTDPSWPPQPRRGARFNCSGLGAWTWDCRRQARPRTSLWRQ